MQSADKIGCICSERFARRSAVSTFECHLYALLVHHSSRRKRVFDITHVQHFSELASQYSAIEIPVVVNLAATSDASSWSSTHLYSCIVEGHLKRECSPLKCRVGKASKKNEQGWRAANIRTVRIRVSTDSLRSKTHMKVIKVFDT